MDGYGIRKIGEQRYREDPGRSYEDFEVGDVYEHWPGRTVTETDNVWFTNLTMNTHPVHFDAHYAATTEFGRCLVNSTLTLALVAGMAVSGSSPEGCRQSRLGRGEDARPRVRRRHALRGDGGARQAAYQNRGRRRASCGFAISGAIRTALS